MKIGIIGLGRMGAAIAQRLIAAGHQVYGFDPQETAGHHAADIGVEVVDSVQAIAHNARIIWLMIPAGAIIDTVLEQLSYELCAGDIIIDGGNSHFADSIRRATTLDNINCTFLDCGTSGGIHGIENGFCLMVGGNKNTYEKLMSLWQAIATPSGFAHVGPSGAGHYVKMVHNGIEYALMQAYAEGFHVLHDSMFGTNALDLAQISELWNHGAVIRSFLLELTSTIFNHDQTLKNISGSVAESGMGAWTVQEAHKQHIPVPMIELALKTRDWSRTSGGNYTTKIIALLRQQFGGHAVATLKDTDTHENN